MKTTQLKYGAAVDGQMQVVALDWKARCVRVDASGLVEGEAALFADLPTVGLYAFQGSHDSQSGAAVLYIGRAGLKSQSLGERARQSFDRFRDRTERQLYSDCAEIVFHWAEFTNRDLLKHVEGLLIRAHCPAFNNQEVRSWYAGPRELLVVNAGRKGRLLPAVAAMYHSAEGWPKATPETETE